MTAMSPISKRKRTKFARPVRFSLQPVRTRPKMPFATMFGGRKHRSKFNFLSESELGYVPQDSVGKFTFICHTKRGDGNKRGKVKKKKSAFHFDS